MKILHFNEASATGTLAISRDLALEQARSGHFVVYWYGERMDTPPDINESFQGDVLTRKCSLSGFGALATLFRIRREVKLYKYDIVHLHSSKAGFLGRLCLVGTSAKLIYSPHCISFMRQDVGKIVRRFFIYLERIANLNRSTYVACSESEKVEINKALPTAYVVLIENAIQSLSDESSVSRHNNRKEKLLVVTTGGIRPQKGPGMFSQISSQIGSEGFEFIWVGDGDKADKIELEKSKVTVTGWVTRKEAQEVARKCDIFLSTSLWEGLPIALLEAMSIGLCPVVCDCAGNIDVIEDGKTGFIFSSLEEAISILNKLRDDRLLLNRVGFAAYKESETRFSIRRFYSEFESLYAKQALTD